MKQTNHRQKLNHTRLIPYDRQQAKADLREMVLDYFVPLEQQEHPLLFCKGLDICYYATTNCLYQKRSCYYE